MKFIIGIILLTISYFYILGHQSEWISMTSTFSLLAQKVQVNIYKIIGRDRQTLQAKNELIQGYKELNSTLMITQCFTGEDLQSFTDAFTALRSEKILGLPEKIDKYYLIRQETAMQIEEQCR